MGFCVDTSGPVTIVRFRDGTSIEDLASAIERSNEFDTPYELWDFSASGFDLETRDLKNFAGLSKTKARRAQRVAGVASDDLTFGLLRMYSVYSDEEATQIAIFRDEASARAWLLDGESR